MVSVDDSSRDLLSISLWCYSHSVAIFILLLLFRYWLRTALTQRELRELEAVNSAPTTPVSPTSVPSPTESALEDETAQRESTNEVEVDDVAGDEKSEEESDEESWDAQNNANRISRLHVPPSVSVIVQQSPAMLMNASSGMAPTMSGGLLSIPEALSEQKRHSVSGVGFDAPKITFADHSDVEDDDDGL